MKKELDAREMLICFGNPLRVQVLEILLSNDSAIPSMIAAKMDISMPLLSYHLVDMVKAGILISIPVGSFRSYVVNIKALQMMQNLFADYEQDCIRKGKVKWQNLDPQKSSSTAPQEPEKQPL